MSKQLRQPAAGDTVATIKTNKGDIKVVLFPDAAPKAVENFTTHADNGYYDGVIFHRVIPDFMIQGGDPLGKGIGGESIWDIKKHIGYVSPELHRSYQRDLPAIRIVASGLMDSVGLYVKPKEEDMDKCRFWMKVFGLEGLEDRGFLKLSSGEQRLVLLARAFVKDPELLILDEPLHGLDNRNRRLVKDVIEAFCRRQNKTMIMVTHYKEELPACIDHSIFLMRHTND